MAGPDVNAPGAATTEVVAVRQKPGYRDRNSGQRDGDEHRASCAAVRLLLHRKTIAAYRYRSAVARKLGVTESEIAVLTHLSEGAMTPGELGRRLQLTSGGMTSVLHRLRKAGRITKRPHPTDHRSTLISARPEVLEGIAELYAPLVADMDRLSGGLLGRDREVLRQYLASVVALSERRADELIAAPDADDDTIRPNDALHLWA
jgi:DNA-binding MarR family transcriptional regulator